ncbi:MAG TPA: ROK family protein [Aggregatilineales bacterium]|jgi:glucokinase|nr:ROK family protein [Aggregatilineales bacterium]
MTDKVVGIDLGGTKIAAAVYDGRTQTLSGQTVVPTRGQEGPDGVLKQIGELVRMVCERADVPLAAIGGVGVGMPATFDLEKGQTLLLPNIPGDWWGKPVVSILQADLERPVALVNDARSFTLAEATLGAGRGYDCVFGLTLGTGIGGGIAINGKLHLGLSGSAGEVGHHSIDHQGVPDGSGNPGGWEAYASGPAIAAMGVKAVMQGITTQIGGLVNYDLNLITPGVILQAAEQGDAIARDILRTAGEYIGAGLSNVIIILAPHCVVIGGGVAELGEWIMEPMRASIARRCKTVPVDQIAIKRAALGSQAGVFGAALQVWQQINAG